MFLVDAKGSCIRHTDSCKNHNIYTPAVICYFSHTNHDYGSISIYTLSIQCNSQIIVSEAMLPLQLIVFFFMNNLHLSVITSYQLSISFFSYLAFCLVTFYETVSTVLLNWHSRKYKNILYRNSVLLDWYKLNEFCQLQNDLQKLKITILFRYSSNQILSWLFHEVTFMAVLIVQGNVPDPHVFKWIFFSKKKVICHSKGTRCRTSKIMNTCVWPPWIKVCLPGRGKPIIKVSRHLISILMFHTKRPIVLWPTCTI